MSGSSVSEIIEIISNRPQVMGVDFTIRNTCTARVTIYLTRLYPFSEKLLYMSENVANILK